MDSILKNKKILLGVTGSIAAYKTPYIVRELIKADAHVNVAMTHSAREFVTPLVLSNLSKNPVAIDMFDESSQTSGAWHIELAHWCDAFMIAPCSATSLGKIANGICDNALITLAVALPRDIPLIIAPAMDYTMYQNAATQRNLETLMNDGAIIIPPEEGELSSGLSGPGRLPELDVLIDTLVQVFKERGRHNSAKQKSVKEVEDKSTRIEVEIEEKKEPFEDKLQEALNRNIPGLQDTVDKDKWTAEMELHKLKGNDIAANNSLKWKKVLITAGPTYERIDDVRFIANHSSGKMGFALARAALNAGAEVTLVTGPVSLQAPDGVKRIDVMSARDMYNAVTSEFPTCDIAIMAAAVADYTPIKPVVGKMKKMDTGDKLLLELHSTTDILAELGSVKKDNQYVIGFALESSEEIDNGKMKLKNKNSDMIVVNSANKERSGFGGEDNTITILTKDGGEESLPPMSKNMCAVHILKKAVDSM